MRSETQSAMAYPTSQQYERWKAEADSRDMSISEFMQAMIEAGLKKFDASIDPDETNRELRQQRNELKAELDRTRARVQQLEEQLHKDDRATIRAYVEDNPGATWDEIVQHLMDTLPQRTTQHLNGMEGETLQVENGEYYLLDGGDGYDDASN